MSIELHHIHKRFGNFVALNDINLEIPEGNLVALLGPSGCGKTTLLRIIAGLEQADSGQIVMHGRNITEQHIQDRNVGFVFQHYALFRHMTVFENIAFGLRVKPRKSRPSDAQIREKVHALLNLVQLDWLHSHFPDQLSGGQRQRIALARALAVEPSVLLLDEPFSALDANVRKDLRRWLRSLHHELHVTSIFVTHDQEEAMEVASQIVVLNHGKLEQKGTPNELYEHPVNSFVSQFIGQTNVFHLENEDVSWLQSAVDVALEKVPGSTAHIRPHDIEVIKADNKASPVLLKNWHHLGSTTHLELSKVECDGGERLIYAQMLKERFQQLSFHKGEPVQLRIKHAYWFD